MWCSCSRIYSKSKRCLFFIVVCTVITFCFTYLIEIRLLVILIWFMFRDVFFFCLSCLSLRIVWPPYRRLYKIRFFDRLDLSLFMLVSFDTFAFGWLVKGVGAIRLTISASFLHFLLHFYVVTYSFHFIWLAKSFYTNIYNTLGKSVIYLMLHTRSAPLLTTSTPSYKSFDKILCILIYLSYIICVIWLFMWLKST